MDELEICRYPGNARSKVWEYLVRTLKSLKTLSYHFDFYLDEKYLECLLVGYSDYNR